MPFPNGKARIPEHCIPPMGNPTPPGHHTVSLPLPPLLWQHVNNQSSRYGISKAGFLRTLIAKDLEARLRTDEG